MGIEHPLRNPTSRRTTTSTPTCPGWSACTTSAAGSSNAAALPPPLPTNCPSRPPAPSFAARRRPDPAPAAANPPVAQVRQWAKGQGMDVPDRGRLRSDIWDAWHAAHAQPVG
ncbi:histone-like nucleoid-structuring protein Lsr2 [Streptomyces sp. NBC_01619]|uniref:Lsr2 family DNA-binding protein n=1 Tax=Streptomyces sp. NBC_01619 TaxID=2975901 RepID=UPI00338F1D8A